MIESQSRQSNKINRLTYLTAGAAGMYCGSCLHDNALVRALRDYGLDATLVPTYTPIRTDEQSIAVDCVFFGGINVYLQQRIPFFRWLPAFLDRWFDNPRLIRRATARSIDMKPEVLGQLAVSMLKGEHGFQRKEVRRLTKWLMRDVRPDLLLFTNLLIGGCIPYIKKATQLPIVVTLQGDDLFLDHLPEQHRQQCIELMGEISTQVDGFLCHSQFYRDYMANYLGIDRDKIAVTPLGIDTRDFEALTPPDSKRMQRDPRHLTVGYLARLAPEKGLHILVDAMIRMWGEHPELPVRLEIAGWLGHEHRQYAEAQFDKLRGAGYGDRFEYLGSIERQEKLEMLQRLDLLCVPTEFLEPKGLYVLEGLAAGVPFVAPDHGAFPELAEDLKGGVLFPAKDSVALAKSLAELLTDHARRTELALHGRQQVLTRRNAQSMAQATVEALDAIV